MPQISLVIFREVLEIVILLVVISAASKNKIINFKTHLILGVVLGIFGAVLLALSMPYIAEFCGGFGQEIFNSSIIFLTAALLSFTVIYMQNYSKKIKDNVSNLANIDNQGLKQKIVFILLVATTIFREGAEISLFLYSITIASKISILNFIISVFIGFIAAAFCGVLFYKGLLKTAKIFSFTSSIFMLIAAGLTSEGFGILGRSGLINILNQNAWDSSWIISDKSILGEFLRMLVSYNSRPSLLEVLSFAISFAAIYTCKLYYKKQNFSNK
jgi:high-affinity iron transporter